MLENFQQEASSLIRKHRDEGVTASRLRFLKFKIITHREGRVKLDLRRVPDKRRRILLLGLLKSILDRCYNRQSRHNRARHKALKPQLGKQLEHRCQSR